MDTAPWVWVLVAVVVVALVVLLLLAGGRRRKAMQEKRDQEHREKAAEIRREAGNMEIDAREREAKAIRARADAEQAQVDAARLRQEAEQRSQEAQSLRGDVASRARKADELDPDVETDGTRRVRGEGGDGPVAPEGAAVNGGRRPDLAGPGREADTAAGYAEATPADADRGAGYMEGTHGDAGYVHSSHHDTRVGEATVETPEGESVRRREARAADTSTENDVRGEGSPRGGI